MSGAVYSGRRKMTFLEMRLGEERDESIFWSLSQCGGAQLAAAATDIALDTAVSGLCSALDLLDTLSGIAEGPLGNL